MADQNKRSNQFQPYKRSSTRIPRGMYDINQGVSSSYPTKGSPYPTFVDYGKIFGEEFQKGMEPLIEGMREKEDEYKENALQSPMKSELDFEKVPEVWHAGLNDALIDIKTDYNKWNKQSLHSDFGSKEHREAQEGMSVAKKNMEKLNTKFTQLAEVYKEHDGFVWSGSYSEGQISGEKEWFFNLMKRDHEDMDFSNGTITWKNIKLADGTTGDFNIQDLKFPNFVKAETISGYENIVKEVRQFANSVNPLEPEEINGKFNTLLTKTGWDGARSLAFDFTIPSTIEGGDPSSFAKWYTGGQTINGKFIPYAQDVDKDGTISETELENLNEYQIQQSYMDGMYSHLGAKPGKYKNWILDPQMAPTLKQELSKYFGGKLKDLSTTNHNKWKEAKNNSVDTQNGKFHGYEFPGEQSHFNNQYRRNLSTLINFAGPNKTNLGADTSTEGQKVDPLKPTYSATPENVKKLATKVAFMITSKKLNILTYDQALGTYLDQDDENTAETFLARPYNNGKKGDLYMLDAGGNINQFIDIDLKKFFTNSDSFIKDVTNHQLKWWDAYPRSDYDHDWSTLKSKTKSGEYVNPGIVKDLTEHLFYDVSKELDN